MSTNTNRQATEPGRSHALAGGGMLTDLERPRSRLREHHPELCTPPGRARRPGMRGGPVATGSSARPATASTCHHHYHQHRGRPDGPAPSGTSAGRIHESHCASSAADRPSVTRGPAARTAAAAPAPGPSALPATASRPLGDHRRRYLRPLRRQRPDLRLDPIHDRPSRRPHIPRRPVRRSARRERSRRSVNASQ